MSFSERVKLLAKAKSMFRCCMCRKPFVEVHHLTPQAEGGTDDIENAAPLCAACHDLFGGNPEKRKTLRQMRDTWWQLVSERNSQFTDVFSNDPQFEIAETDDYQGALSRSRTIIYHRVLADENFEFSASAILSLVHQAQCDHPGKTRALYVDIEGHRKKDGRYDRDMAELQVSYLANFMIQFVSEIHAPLLNVRNVHLQVNVVPSELEFLDSSPNSVTKAFASGAEAIWLADINAMLKANEPTVEIEAIRPGALIKSRAKSAKGRPPRT